jgi:hypothetical protein
VKRLSKAKGGPRDLSRPQAGSMRRSSRIPDDGNAREPGNGLLQQLQDDLSESLEQQTATSEVLKVISSSPGELEPVFETMLGNAVRVCGAKFGVMQLYDEGTFRTVAMHNVPPAFAELRRANPIVRPSPRTGLGRVASTRQVVQIPDLTKEQTYREREPASVPWSSLLAPVRFLSCQC